MHWSVCCVVVAALALAAGSAASAVGATAGLAPTPPPTPRINMEGAYRGTCLHKEKAQVRIDVLLVGNAGTLFFTDSEGGCLYTMMNMTTRGDTFYANLIVQASDNWDCKATNMSLTLTPDKYGADIVIESEHFIGSCASTIRAIAPVPGTPTPGPPLPGPSSAGHGPKGAFTGAANVTENKPTLFVVLAGADVFGIGAIWFWSSMPPARHCVYLTPHVVAVPDKMNEYYATFNNMGTVGTPEVCPKSLDVYLDLSQNHGRDLLMTAHIGTSHQLFINNTIPASVVPTPPAPPPPPPHALVA